MDTRARKGHVKNIEQILLLGLSMPSKRMVNTKNGSIQYQFPEGTFAGWPTKCSNAVPFCNEKGGIILTT
ncbi:hypothetical protein CEJ83_20090 [Acinetobacter baumannii]|nr:hypothetical protein CEJ83_20090 [Acinetobacter baumannii]